MAGTLDHVGYARTIKKLPPLIFILHLQNHHHRTNEVTIQWIECWTHTFRAQASHGKSGIVLLLANARSNKIFYYNDSNLDSHLWIKKIRCTAGRLSFKDEVNWCYITMLYDWDWFRKLAPPLSHSSFAALSLSPWDVYLADSRNFFYEFNRMTLHLISVVNYWSG